MISQPKLLPNVPITPLCRPRISTNPEENCPLHREANDSETIVLQSAVELEIDQNEQWYLIKRNFAAKLKFVLL